MGPGVTRGWKCGSRGHTAGESGGHGVEHGSRGHPGLECGFPGHKGWGVRVPSTAQQAHSHRPPASVSPLAPSCSVLPCPPMALPRPFTEPCPPPRLIAPCALPPPPHPPQLQLPWETRQTGCRSCALSCGMSPCTTCPSQVSTGPTSRSPDAGARLRWGFRGGAVNHCQWLWLSDLLEECATDWGRGAAGG